MYDGLHTLAIIAASLVIVMTAPGLALFYGGMSRGKAVLNMMMMSFSALGVVGIVYVLWGWSMSYAPGASGDVAGLFADPFAQFGLNGVDRADYMSVGFQLTFAVITAALVSGAIAERVKFSAWLVFVPAWVTLSYFPLAHMVWGGGILSDAGDGLAAALFGTTDGVATVAPVDYAGGTVVHIDAGVAGLVLVLLVGKRIGFGRDPMKPHNLTLTMIGAGLLWVGWYGFNVGSFIAPDRPDNALFVAETGLTWLNTTVAGCAAMVGWLIYEQVRFATMTSLGAASGAVAGLVAVTPACGALSPVGSIVLGLVAGGVCAAAVGLKHRLGYDDSLDVVGVHLVGGLIGTVGIGFLAADGGLLYGDGPRLLVVQIVVAMVAVIWSGMATLSVGLLIKVAIGWRVSPEAEVEGIDDDQHGESGYDITPGTGVLA